MTATPSISVPIRLASVLAAALFALGCAPSSAQAPKPSAAPAAAAPAAAPAGDVRASIAKELNVPVESVKPSPVPGLFEVVHSSEVLYATADGKFAIAGDLYDLATKTNLSERRRMTARAEALRTVPDDETITFGPADAKYTIDVFTDVDCAYCRKLHSQIADYNKLGIRVRYMAFPRTGPDTESWTKAVSVWCAPNRQEALTKAKAGETPPARACATAPVAKTYELGKSLQIRGTPGVFTPAGDYVAGYLPPQDMLERLQKLEAANKAAAGG